MCGLQEVGKTSVCNRLKRLGLLECVFERERAFGGWGQKDWRCEKDNAEAPRALRFAEKKVVDWVAGGSEKGRGVGTGGLHRSLPER
jgi:hypothetical protein